MNERFSGRKTISHQPGQIILTLARHPEARAISAFTRVFDALWRASKDERPTHLGRILRGQRYARPPQDDGPNCWRLISRISACLLATALSSILAVPLAVAPSLAKDAGAGAYAHVEPHASMVRTPPAGENAPSTPARTGDRSASPGKGSTKDNDGGATADRHDRRPAGAQIRSATSSTKNTERIDTRITVEPRRLPGPREETGVGEVRVPAAIPFQRRRLFVFPGTGRVVRNAIGVVVGHEGERRGYGGFRNSRTVVRLPGEVMHTGSGAAGSPAKATGALGRTGLNDPAAKPPLATIRWRGGAIDGSGIVRLGSGPARLGGPAPKSAGINGSTLRRKY